MTKTIQQYWNKFYLPALKSYTAEKVPTLAAAISYYTIFSIAPVIVLIVLVLGVALGDQTIKAQIITSLNSILGSDATDLLNNLINNSFNFQGQILAVFVGFIGLLLAINGLIDELELAFNTIWQTEVNRKISQNIVHKLSTLLFVIVVAIIILGGLFLSSFLNNHVGSFMLLKFAVNFITSLIVLFLSSAVTFKFLLKDKILTRAVVFSSINTAVFIAVGQLILNWYLSNFASVSAYGSASSLVILLLWVFYICQILLFSVKVGKLYDSNLKNNLENQHNISKIKKSATGKVKVFSLVWLVSTALIFAASIKNRTK